ncbi:hypothetical protein [Geotoga petraea]|uniref:Uncharacterized protein n=1 Tax=Geotoga petraea TaxID=28234 RepID=A0A1G6LU19_9BACT|nr:hypothetical protein [Geotoga petraea]SDC46709.1 hypothetical protein SAMN04488588_1145 [Geotoga petraea]
MALIKEDYGLIYNDDGSLCVTVREDDVPFEGVKSYAIEESTENLVPSNLANFEDLNWGSVSIISREIIEGGGYNGRNAVKIVKDDTQINFQIYDTNITSNIKNNIQVGDRISYQIKYKIIDPGSGGTFNFRTWGFSTTYPINDIDIGNGWKLRYGTSPEWTDTSDITGSVGISEMPPNSTILFCDFQIEIKPYPTSFVDGSRAKGKLYFSSEKLNTKNYTLDDGSKVNLFNNHVVSFWFKVPKVQDEEIISETYTWDFIQQIIGNDHDVLTGSHRRRQWAIIISRQDGDLGISAPYLGFSHYVNVLDTVGNYEDKWHHIVFIFDVINESSTEIYREHKVYYDGILKRDVFANLYVSGSPSINDDIWFNEDYRNRSNLISNLFIGKYKDEQGNVIWTDEYIQEVYEAKKPFNTNL